MRILYGVLNWGLGHASRSAPVIEQLCDRGHEVLLASDGISGEWLRNRFPSLKYLEVPGLQPVYPESGNMVWAMARQLPGFLSALRKEQAACRKLSEEYKADRIISDNRYGFYHPSVPSAIICHQLQLQMPAGASWITPFIQAYNHRTLRRFSDVWVPDFPDHQLSGSLSEWNDPKVKFIGPLTHLPQNISTTRAKKKYLFLISGPEPQRSILERKILRWGKLPARDCTLVRGTSDKRKSPTPVGLEVLDLANSQTIAELLLSHELVICRPGYSTLSDLNGSGLKALVIPTPGQTEQEYLGRRLHKQNVAFCSKQEDFNPDEQIDSAMKMKGFSLKKNASDNLLQQTLDRWL